MLNGTPAFPQSFAALAAPRRTYRDIPDQYDRMGQVMPFQSFPQGPAAFGNPYARWADTSMSAPTDSVVVQQQVGAPFCGTLQCCPVPKANVAYERIVGLPRVCIDECDCETIESSVCGPFTLMGLYIAPKVAHFLSITRLQVGCHNLLVNCDPIPAEIFSCCEILGETTITAPTIDSNSPICIEVENEAHKEVEFKGAMYGLLCLSCP